MRYQLSWEQQLLVLLRLSAKWMAIGWDSCHGFAAAFLLSVLLILLLLLQLLFILDC
jgi:hypothetical protein